MEFDEMEVVERIRAKLEARAINVGWPTSENFSSASPRKSRRKGPGFEFAGSKVFDPADGDDSRRIDWNASAAEPDEDTYIVRTFRKPRLIRLSVLLNVNKSMNMGTKGTLKGLLAATVAGCAVISARKTKDRASFVSFARHPVTILKAQNASRLLMPALIHSVADRLVEDVDRYGIGSATASGASTAAANEDDDCGGGLALALATARQKEKSLMLLISDFVDMNEDDWEALRINCITNEVLVVFVQDRRERELPRVPFPGVFYNLEDLRGRNASLWVAPDAAPRWYIKLCRKLFGSSTTAAEYAENFKRHEENILQRLAESGASVFTVTTDEEDEAIRVVLGALANKLRM
jgi:Uncharacterized conserved protein (some members contain a von Willebrand factor type A (vWA) domain)